MPDSGASQGRAFGHRHEPTCSAVTKTPERMEALLPEEEAVTPGQTSEGRGLGKQESGDPIGAKPFFQVLKQTGLSQKRLLEGFGSQSKSWILGNVSPKLIFFKEVAQNCRLIPSILITPNFIPGLQ